MLWGSPWPDATLTLLGAPGLLVVRHPKSLGTQGCRKTAPFPSAGSQAGTGWVPRAGSLCQACSPRGGAGCSRDWLNLLSAWLL